MLLLKALSKLQMDSPLRFGPRRTLKSCLATEEDGSRWESGARELSLTKFMTRRSLSDDGTVLAFAGLDSNETIHVLRKVNTT